MSRGNKNAGDNSKRVKIYKYSLSGEFIEEYSSIAKASRDVGVTSAAIVNCAKGKTKSSGGYNWSYKKEKELEKVDKVQRAVRVGEVFEGKHGTYKVISFSHEGPTQEHFLVEFFDTGFKTVTSDSNIRNLSVRDYYVPTIAGVGFLGDTQKYTMREYSTWRDMIRRCYDRKNKGYENYGKLGISVCDRWHNFTNFQNDIKKIDGYSQRLFESNQIILDKDKKQKQINVKDKIYSPSTCVFITKKENSLLAREKDMLTFAEVSSSGEIIKVFKNAQKYARKKNFNGSEFRKKLHNGTLVIDNKKIKLITREEYNFYANN